MFELKVVTSFVAAHQLTMVSQKCENLHGHNWKVETCVKGKELNSAGVLKDFGEIKANVRELMSRLDHKFLNELEAFDDGNASSERIAVYIAEELQSMIEEPDIKVSKVSVWESDNACATYIVD
jgi:6-pyruvoyltetrahydropterin/6-carboxytetrahydropterin synthase